MTTTKGQRAAIYCRISKDADQRGMGVARQERECRELCRREGWQVAEVYVDNDLSAYDRRHRPRYRQLLDDVRGGLVDVVVARHEDRLLRDVREGEDLIDLVESTKVRVVLIDGLVELNSSRGRENFRNAIARAKGESERKSERLRLAHADIAAQGGWKGGPRPYGYALGDVVGGSGAAVEVRTLSVVDDEAAIIREAARRVLAGESVYAICQDFNRREVPTAQSNGQLKSWRTPTLSRILTNPTISGKREHRGEILCDALWKPIISETDWLRLRRLLHDENRAVGRRPRSWLLTGGIAWCGQCSEKPLYGQRRTTGARVYCCIPGVDKDGCGKLSCVADPVEALVVEAVLQRLDSPKLAAAMHGSEKDDQRSEDEKLAAKLEGRLEELAQMFATGEIGRKEWLVARDAIDAQLRLIRQRQSRMDRGRALAPYAKPGSLRKAWPDLTLEKKRAVIKAVIDRIVIKPASKFGPIFDDDRVDIIWRG